MMGFVVEFVVRVGVLWLLLLLFCCVGEVLFEVTLDSEVVVAEVAVSVGVLLSFLLCRYWWSRGLVWVVVGGGWFGGGSIKQEPHT